MGRLKRSLLQGCPLSPLLYLLVTNTLSWILIVVVDKGLIRGVPIKETDEQHTHVQFADDTNIIVEATREVINNNLAKIRMVGEASGFFIKEVGIKAILISTKPLPADLASLDWI